MKGHFFKIIIGLTVLFSIISLTTLTFATNTSTSNKFKDIGYDHRTDMKHAIVTCLGCHHNDRNLSGL